jgi:hypothetical protein
VSHQLVPATTTTASCSTAAASKKLLRIVCGKESSYSHNLVKDNTQVKMEDSPKLSLWLRTGTSRCLKWSRMQKTGWIKNVSEIQERSHALHLITLRTWCRPKSQGQGWQTSANQCIYIYIYMCSSQWCSSQCTHSAWLLSKLQNLLQH